MKKYKCSEINCFLYFDVIHNFTCKHFYNKTCDVMLYVPFILVTSNPILLNYNILNHRNF